MYTRANIVQNCEVGFSGLARSDDRLEERSASPLHMGDMKTPEGLYELLRPISIKQ